MDELLDANRANWDERTALHLHAYPVDEFRVGRTDRLPFLFSLKARRSE